jgi:hypothetical protein
MTSGRTPNSNQVRPDHDMPKTTSERPGGTGPDPVGPQKRGSALRTGEVTPPLEDRALYYRAMANIHGVLRTSFASIALRAVLLLTAFASLQSSAQQPAYPAKTIRLIASQAPGGGIDSVSRIVSTKLSEAVGQTVIVDNRAGANGSLAAELTAKSAPDGYTLMLGAVGNLAINTFFYKQLGYDPLQDLAPVTLAISGSNMLVVHPSVPARSVKELITLARARPGVLALGSSGPGVPDISPARCSSP